MNEQELRLAILKLAMCFCFDEAEDYLSLHQIIDRGFSPIDSYTINCVNQLIKRGAVEMIKPRSIKSTDEIFIKRFVNQGKETEEFVYLMSEKVMELVATSLEYEKYLQTFSEEIKACECIEYSLYYAKKSDINITLASIHDVRLRLLFLRCSQDKIQMLLWRAIRTISKANPINTEIPFSKITDAAFDYYIGYARENIEIESYQRPRILKPSILSGMLEIFSQQNK